MTIEINRPEVEALIRERLEKGGFKDPQDMILQALRDSEKPLQESSEELVAALRSSPANDFDQAPEWLKQSWAGAHESGLDVMTMDEIDAEIKAARLARRQPRSS